MASILVVGGTGVVGRAVVAVARARDHDVRSLSREVPQPGSADRAPGVDYRSCDLYHANQTTLDEHVNDVDVVIDCLNGVPHVAQAVFRIGAAQITDAAARAGVTRIVVASDVGCDQSDFSYYEAKTDQEGVYLDSPVPTTVVRFTAVFEQLLEFATKAARFGVIPTSNKAQLQPIDVCDIAEILVDAAADTGTDEIVSYGGPEVASVRELTQQWLQHTKRRALLVPVPLVLAIGRYLRSGASVVPDSRCGSTTWRAWLERTVPGCSSSTLGGGEKNGTELNGAGGNGHEPSAA